MIKILADLVNDKITYDYAKNLIEDRQCSEKDKDLWLELAEFIENAKDFIGDRPID